MGAIFAMAQTPDGYLWLGTEFGLFRFDGLHAVPGTHRRGNNFPTLLEDREGTVRAGISGRLTRKSGRSAMRNCSGHAECYLQGGAFGTFV